MVCKDIADRQRLGINKYGTTVMESNEIGLKPWLVHAYQECLDQAIYLRRAIEEIESMKKSNKLKAKFLGKNGYPGEAELAKAQGLKPGRRYEITGASISQSSSRVTVKGRQYNSVLFDVDVSTLIAHFPDSFGYAKGREA